MYVALYGHHSYWFPQNLLNLPPACEVNGSMVRLLRQQAVPRSAALQTSA